MKDMISAVFIIVSLFAGTVALKNFQDMARKSALEKAAKGLPSLIEMTNSLQRKK